MTIQDLHPARVLSMLDTSRIGRSIILLEQAGSTNSEAFESAGAGIAEGSVFVAIDQTEGRGRKGREWFSTGNGSLLFSIVLDFSGNMENLTSLLGLAAATSIESCAAGISVSIKWPNDLYIEGRKTGGILAESRGKAAVLGLGLDINQRSDEFPGPLKEEAISLREAAGRELDRGVILAEILGVFEKYYEIWEREGFGVFRFEMESRLLWKGKRTVLHCPDRVVSGILSGLDADGHLRLETGAGEEVFLAGDLSLEKELE